MHLAHGVTVTVHARSAGVDAYGDPLPPVGESWEIAGCGVAPASGPALDSRGRAGVVEHATLYAPPGVDLEPGDLVDLDLDGFAGTWRIDGAVLRWSSPISGYGRGVIAELVKARG